MALKDLKSNLNIGALVNQPLILVAIYQTSQKLIEL